MVWIRTIPDPTREYLSSGLPSFSRLYHEVVLHRVWVRERQKRRRLYFTSPFVKLVSSVPFTRQNPGRGVRGKTTLPVGKDPISASTLSIIPDQKNADINTPQLLRDPFGYMQRRRLLRAGQGQTAGSPRQGLSLPVPGHLRSPGVRGLRGK